MKKFLATLFFFLAPLAYAKSVANVSISPQGAVIQNGSSLQFSATCTYSDNSVDNCAAAGAVTWSSSWNSRMAVNASGMASAIEDPLADVSPNNTNRYLNQFVLLTVGGVTARAGVYTQHAGDTWYRYPTPDYRSFTTYGAQNPTLNVAIGSRVALGEGFLVNNTDGGNGFPIQSLCTWSSSDPTKATIDNDARVTALAAGMVTFTCNIGGNGNFGSSTQGGWQAPGNVITLNIVAGGTGSATWYIRPDGGTPYISASRTPAGQCNGHGNAAYTGHGTNQNCALGNLSFLWADQVTPNSLGWIITGGDTVIVAPNANRYVIGKTGVNCAGDPGYNCFMPTIPSGTVAHHTRILGSNYASCHADAAKTGLTLDLQASAAFNITDSQFVDVACFEITDAAACSTSSNFTNHCTATDHFGQFGIVEDSLASANLTDLAIHGLAAEAIHGPSGPDVVADHLRISGMPFGGIDMDNAAWHATNISSAGGFTLTNSVTEFTGCVEEYPVVHTYPYIECRDQNTGGYGDGLGTANTSGDWVFDHDIWRYNFQDGLDLLHSGMKSLSVTNSQSYGNDGQQYKVGSGQKILFANNTAVGNCERILAPFGDEPSSAIIPGVTGCRAAGDGILISMAAVGSDTFQNNTYVGYGNTSYDMACESGFETCPNAKSTFQNNINIGIVNSVYQPGLKPGLFYTGSASMPANSGWAVRDHNLYFNFRNGTGCPAPLNAGELCTDANFVDEPSLTISQESVLDNFNFNLIATSPAKYAGVQLPVLNLQTPGLSLANLLGTDLLGTVRNSPPSIGALEFVSGSLTPPSPVSPPAPTAPSAPVAPTKQPTSLSLSISPSLIVAGQTITLSASLSSVDNLIPTGTISFSINGTTLSASLTGTGSASISVGSLPANTYMASATYLGDANYIAATSNPASVTITPTPPPAPASKAISVVIGQPSFGFNLIPGSVRRIFADVTNGVTNQVNWSVKSGNATISARTGSWIDVTAPATGSPCIASGASSSSAVSSKATVILEAVSVEDNTQKADLMLTVCKPTVQLSIVPAYRTLYANQTADLQSMLIGSTNEGVTWTIRSKPSNGDGKLTRTTSRATVFSATSPGRYLVTATSNADAREVASAIFNVTGRPMSHRGTRDDIKPVALSADPTLVGRLSKIGPA